MSARLRIYIYIYDVTEYQSSACACEQERKELIAVMYVCKRDYYVSNAMNIRYHLYIKSNYVLYIWQFQLYIIDNHENLWYSFFFTRWWDKYLLLPVFILNFFLLTLNDLHYVHIYENNFLSKSLNSYVNWFIIMSHTSHYANAGNYIQVHQTMIRWMTWI